MRPYAPPRFEYRIWGEAFPRAAAARSRAAEPGGLPATGRGRRGQRQAAWRCARGQAPARHPRRAAGMAAGAALSLAAAGRRDRAGSLPSAPCGTTAADAGSYPLERFLDEVASALVGVRVVALDKQRRTFEVAGSRAERTRVTIGGITLETVAIEAERFAAAAAAADQLGLRRAPNVDYVSALASSSPAKRPSMEKRRDPSTTDRRAQSR